MGSLLAAYCQGNTVIIDEVQRHLDASRLIKAHISEGVVGGEGDILFEVAQTIEMSEDIHLSARHKRKEEEEVKELLHQLEIIVYTRSVKDEWVCVVASI